MHASIPSPIRLHVTHKHNTDTSNKPNHKGTWNQPRASMALRIRMTDVPGVVDPGGLAWTSTMHLFGLGDTSPKTASFHSQMRKTLDSKVKKLYLQ